MPEKFPEKLPPKGEGRVDSKHRVALLTEPEIGALNFLKNMDRAMGYKSGFSPMMQNLAAQNTQPLEYVEYRGERIPSLNDFGMDEGSVETGGREDRGGGTFNEGSSASGGESDWAKKQRKKREKRQKDLKDIEDYIAMMDAANYGESGGYAQGDTTTYYDKRPERDPGYRPPEYGEPGYEEPTRTTTPDDDGDGLTQEEFESMAAEYEIYPEYEAYDGSMHYSQASADAVNENLTTEARSGKETDLTDYGSETSSGVYDEIASDFETYLNDTLAGQRQTAYDQALAGLYDDQQKTGLWDQEAYDAALEGLDSAVETETGELEDYGKSLKSDAEDAYNTWLTEQMSGLGELEYSDIGDWEWGDLDLSEFTDNQEYNDFDFLDEFKKIDPEGNTIEATPAEGTGTEEGGAEEGGAGGGGTSRTVTRKKKKYTPTYSSASLTGGGSSSNIS